MGKHVEKLSDVQIRRWIKAGKPIAKADGGGLTFTLSTGGTAANNLLGLKFKVDLKDPSRGGDGCAYSGAVLWQPPNAGRNRRMG